MSDRRRPKRPDRRGPRVEITLKLPRCLKCQSALTVAYKTPQSSIDGTKVQHRRCVTCGEIFRVLWI